jgi:hypothetical protein
MALTSSIGTVTWGNFPTWHLHFGLLFNNLHWQLFLYVTKEVSHNSVPLVHQVIPNINKLFDALEDEASNIENFPTVRMTAKHGRAMLFKYYGLTDETAIYQVVMSMGYILSLNSITDGFIQF